MISSILVQFYGKRKTRWKEIYDKNVPDTKSCNTRFGIVTQMIVQQQFLVFFFNKL